MDELSKVPEYRQTMERLERLKHLNADGTEFWLAREIAPVLGYPVWQNFESVIDRARDAFKGNHVEPSHQIMLTHKMMEVGRGARIKSVDYFLSRAACSLIAMNGDPSKPEIAAAQAYFVVRTRESELRESDERRLEVREKVAQAFKAVSGVAHDAGVRNAMQAIFHDARSHGLYGMSSRDVKRKKGIAEDDSLFDRAGRLELSMHEFQMNLTTDVIVREGIRGEARAINKNKEIAQYVRKSVEESGATMPEDLPLEEPIREVRKRLAQQKQIAPPKKAN